MSTRAFAKAASCAAFLFALAVLGCNDPAKVDGLNDQAHGFGAGPGFTQTPGGVRVSGSPSAGESPQWDGVQWQSRVANDYRSKHLDYSDEWFVGSCGNGTQCGSIFQLAINGGGQNGNVGTTTRPGIYQINTSTSATGRMNLQTNVSSFDFASYTTLVFEATVGFQTLSTVAEEYWSIVGFEDTPSSANQVDGCWFLYDRLPSATAPTTGTIAAGADKLQCWCSSNSVRTGYTMDGVIVSDGGFTTVNAPVAAYTMPDTNVLRLKIVMTGAAEADFYVNNVKSCVITTHIPSGASRLTGLMFSITKTAGTTSRGIDIDQDRLSGDMLAARSL